MKRDHILIEADELLTKIDDPNLRIFDANINFFPKDGEPTAHEVYMEKHIRGAAFMDHQNLSDPDNAYRYMVLGEAELGKQIGNLGISNASEVVIYSSGMLATATRAWWVLRYAGHNNVRVLNGGLSAWEAAGGQIESGDNSYDPATFTAQVRPDMFVNKDDVQAALADDKVETSYALSAGAYGGKMITGTTCLPFDNLMQDMIVLLPDDQLAATLKTDAPTERVITYCGGGIAATVNAIAHLIAGNENVAVYDGSLSEWMGEGLPTTTGTTA